MAATYEIYFLPVRYDRNDPELTSVRFEYQYAESDSGYPTVMLTNDGVATLGADGNIKTVLDPVSKWSHLFNGGKRKNRFSGLQRSYYNGPNSDTFINGKYNRYDPGYKYKPGKTLQDTIFSDKSGADCYMIYVDRQIYGVFDLSDIHFNSGEIDAGNGFFEYHEDNPTLCFYDLDFSIAGLYRVESSDFTSMISFDGIKIEFDSTNNVVQMSYRRSDTNAFIRVYEYSIDAEEGYWVELEAGADPSILIFADPNCYGDYYLYRFLNCLEHETANGYGQQHTCKWLPLRVYDIDGIVLAEDSEYGFTGSTVYSYDGSDSRSLTILENGIKYNDTGEILEFTNLSKKIIGFSRMENGQASGVIDYNIGDVISTYEQSLNLMALYEDPSESENPEPSDEYYMVKKDTLIATANAIRAKTGSVDKICPEDFAEEIRSICGYGFDVATDEDIDEIVDATFP